MSKKPAPKKKSSAKPAGKPAPAKKVAAKPVPKGKAKVAPKPVVPVKAKAAPVKPAAKGGAPAKATPAAKVALVKGKLPLKGGKAVEPSFVVNEPKSAGVSPRRAPRVPAPLRSITTSRRSSSRVTARITTRRPPPRRRPGRSCSSIRSLKFSLTSPAGRRRA